MQYLAQMINNHLSTFKRVDIADVGSLELVQNPAKLDVAKSQVFPPYKSIEFDSKKALRARYSLHASSDLMTVSDARREELLHMIEGLGSSIWEVTGAGSRFELPFVGSFYQKDGAIRFAQDDSSPLLAAGHRMANIHFVPIKRLESVKTIPPVAPANSTTKKKVKQIAVTLAFVLIAVNVGLLGWALLKKFQDDPFDRLPVNLPEGRVNVKPSMDAPLPKALPMPVDSAQLQQDSLVSPDSLEDTSGVLQSFVPEPEEKVDSPKPEVKVEKENLSETEPAKKSPAPTKPNNKASYNNTSLLLELNTRGDDCALVLGAFSKAGNVTRMKSQLESEGYRVYEERGNNLTRVGIFVPCEETNRVLREARNKYNPEAWVFKIK